MKRKATATDGQATKDVRFVRNFEHIDGNWPSHVYLDGNVNPAIVMVLCQNSYIFLQTQAAINTFKTSQTRA